jgi:hypothetical protein
MDIFAALRLSRVTLAGFITSPRLEHQGRLGNWDWTSSNPVGFPAGLAACQPRAGARFIGSARSRRTGVLMTLSRSLEEAVP